MAAYFHDGRISYTRLDRCEPSLRAYILKAATLVTPYLVGDNVLGTDMCRNLRFVLMFGHCDSKQLRAFAFSNSDVDLRFVYVSGNAYLSRSSYILSCFCSNCKVSIALLSRVDSYCVAFGFCTNENTCSRRRSYC
jgi:hypothetical protein